MRRSLFLAAMLPALIACDQGEQSGGDVTSPSTALFLAIKPPSAQPHDSKWRFELRNVSSETYWINYLPNFDPGTKRGDVIVSIEDAAGKLLRSACIFHDVTVPRRPFPYTPLPPGKTETFRNTLGCFELSAAQPGTLTIKAKYRPRNVGCEPRPGMRCFAGETAVATAKARLVEGKLVGL
jgi:hypothetical protein